MKPFEMPLLCVFLHPNNLVIAINRNSRLLKRRLDGVWRLEDLIEFLELHKKIN
jgi:hypothetical protein